MDYTGPTQALVRPQQAYSIGVAVYHLAKLRMLDFYYNFSDKYIDRSDFALTEMDTDSNFFPFSEDSIEKIIEAEMRGEYEKDKYNFLPSESQELHPSFIVDGLRFTYAQYNKRTPGLFKVETSKDKMISLCSKVYCASDITEEEIELSCKGIQTMVIMLIIKNFTMCYLINIMIKY